MRKYVAFEKSGNFVRPSYEKWYTPKERKEYIIAVRHFDTEKIKSLCRCSKEKTGMCPACQLLEADDYFHRILRINLEKYDRD